MTGTTIKIANIRAGAVVPPGGDRALVNEYYRLGRPLTADEVEALFQRLIQPTPDGGVSDDA